MTVIETGSQVKLTGECIPWAGVELLNIPCVVLAKGAKPYDWIVQTKNGDVCRVLDDELELLITSCDYCGRTDAVVGHECDGCGATS